MKIKFFLILLFIVFLISCSSQDFGSLDFSDSAKEELRQLLQKPSPDTFDAAYNFHSSIGSQSLVDITFRNAKQGNNQRQEVLGNIFGFNLSSYSVTNGGKQVTCALFNNSWECGAGNEVCREISNGKTCYSVEQEGIPPTIKPEQLAKANVAKAEQKQMLGMQVQCYKLLTTESGNKALTEVCLNQDGIIMSIAINAKLFQAIFEAKSFSTNVQPELFVMPKLSTVHIKTLPTTPASETANWKTHQIEEYGVQLRYPMEWKVEKEYKGQPFDPLSDKIRGDFYRLILVSPDFTQFSSRVEKGGILDISIRPPSYLGLAVPWEQYEDRQLGSLNIDFRKSEYLGNVIFVHRHVYPFRPANSTTTYAFDFSMSLETIKSEEKVYEDIFNKIISISSFGSIKSVETTPIQSKKVSNISASSLSKVNITVESNPLGADVYIDDAFTGNAPITRQMPLGIYLVRCELNGYANTFTSVGVTEAGAESGVLGAVAVCNMKPKII